MLLIENIFNLSANSTKVNLKKADKHYIESEVHNEQLVN
jgi:transcription antitermination factor NusA-like protein